MRFSPWLEQTFRFTQKHLTQSERVVILQLKLIRVRIGHPSALYDWKIAHNNVPRIRSKGAVQLAQVCVQKALEGLRVRRLELSNAMYPLFCGGLFGRHYKCIGDEFKQGMGERKIPLCKQEHVGGIAITYVQQMLSLTVKSAFFGQRGGYFWQS
eukprot:GEMP01091962.1.p1 GENE.GEMP01091962.1~~GEMP01091962.1.p1  ORF type:complete len:155 (-),score=16.05 GEMP01091962.1:239-703(-)